MNGLIEILTYKPDNMTMALIMTLAALITGLYTILILKSRVDETK